MSLVFTETDLNNLKAALVSGALRVRIGDRDVIYRSQTEILKLIEMIQNYLQGASAQTCTANIVPVIYKKGAK